MTTLTDTTTDTATEQFRTHVIRGLQLKEKKISSRYFYDDEGNRLFQKIMASPDYYVPRAEEEILRDQTDAVLAALINGHEQFSLFELGAGDGTKTKHLLRAALDKGKQPTYLPIDISEHVLEELGDALKEEFPTLQYEPMQGEYFDAIKRGFSDRPGPKAVLFLGSNIGNLDRKQAIALLKGVSEHLGPNDRFLVGFDRKKDPATILRAYNDREGHTREFNLNLLRRMNTELGADFNVDRFIHAPVYDPLSGRALSYIVSTTEQTVIIPGADGPIHFEAWEALHTEISQKYDKPMIDDLAAHAGLRRTATFTDSKEYFRCVVFAPNTKAQQPT